MSPSERWRRVPMGAEVALAFAAGAVAFALVAVPLAATDSHVVAVVIGAAALAVVAGLVLVVGVAYAVPAAIAGLLAFDWFQFPPTHAREFPKPADLADLMAYLVVGVFVGVLATRAGRRAQLSELARSELADEQAALRRVATLVARRVAPAELFTAVARELGELLGVDATHMGRYEPDGSVTGVGSWSRAGDHLPLGTKAVAEGDNVTAIVRRTGRPARMDSYAAATGAPAELLKTPGIRSSVGAPIVVNGALWGVMIASSKKEQPLPEGTESRIADFTELVATAISNTEAWAAARALADEQAALRRVATLVAQSVPAGVVFEAVTAEVGRLLGADLADMVRFEGGRAVRIEDWSGLPGRTSEVVRGTLGVRGSVASPVIVEGQVWGALIVHSTRARGLPPDTEERLRKFTELVAAAISNAESRRELTASRARVVAASDQERRRVVRDLHDGAQQRLVHTVVTLKLAQQALERGEDVTRFVDDALAQAEDATAALRELAHGILPAVLTHGGLRPAVEALASRANVVVDNAVEVDRLPAPVEATAYFVVAEALTNVVKHARAGRASVKARVEDGALELCISDDGVGGARADGSGLLGLADRVAVLDGTLRVEAPPGGGTTITATLPLEQAAAVTVATDQ